MKGFEVGLVSRMRLPEGKEGKREGRKEEQTDGRTLGSHRREKLGGENGKITYGRDHIKERSLSIAETADNAGTAEGPWEPHGCCLEVPRTSSR